MIYYAHVMNGTVQRVEVLVASIVEDKNGQPQEAIGQDFMVSLYPETAANQWVQTHHSDERLNPYPRGKMAGIGDLWDGVNFVTPPAPNA